MPRAEPNRSAYCSSRHLLRNLDDAVELRRNPLTQSYFASRPTTRRDRADEQHALDRIRAQVHCALARFRPPPGVGRARGDLGRMHAALLRCEIDRQPLAVVAAELNLSERQLRRERRAAHDAFADAFALPAPASRPATASPDLAMLRLTEAAELHELGQSRLAQSACARIATSAPSPTQRIEALCLAAEIQLDALRYDEAAAQLTQARGVLELRAHELDAAAVTAAEERIEFGEWLLRWQSGVSVGLAAPPPEITTPRAAARERDEPGRALLARALAAYAEQRWEVGDVTHGREALVRGYAAAATLGPLRAKERLALLYADARLFGLREAPGADEERFAKLEALARSKGYLRTMLGARAERIGSAVTTPRGERIFDAVLEPFGAAERGTMSAAVAAAALIVVQCERDPCNVYAAAALAERLASPRSATALLARCMRASHALEQRRYADAWTLAFAVRADAELAGNARVRGSAARYLAMVAVAQRRPGTARRYITEALTLLVNYGTQQALAQAREIARRVNAG